VGFNGHPPLGVNATAGEPLRARRAGTGFQWAPTLGGECYTAGARVSRDTQLGRVSMGTHPWG